jgi:hypothetical protein
MEVSGYLHAPTALPPGKQLMIPIVEEAGRTPVLVWTLWRREKYLAPAGNRTQTPLPSRPHPSRYTDWAIPAPY